MQNDIKQFLTKGLQGYATDGEISDVTRAGFSGKANHLVDENGDVYHDEWFVPDHLGGGQELVKVGSASFTRLYAGGTPPIEKLTELGITLDEVGACLKKNLATLGDKTRLDQNCKPTAEGDWQYSYEVVLNDEPTGIIVGVESIFYKGERVHLHPFILSPME